MTSLRTRLKRVQPLGKAIEYLRGITFDPNELVPPLSDGSVVCMRTKNIQDTLDESDLIAVPDRLVRRAELFLREGDILLSSANSWELVGKTCRVPSLTYRATAGGFIAIVRAKAGTDPGFLAHWLRIPDVQARIRNCARRTTNIANLSVAQFENLEMPSFSESEQRRVADILDKADGIRRKREEGLALTDALLRSAFFEMVGPGARDYASWARATIESLAADGPNSMRTGPFGSDLRHSEFVDDGVAVLGIDNAVQNRFMWGERRFITSQKYEKLKRYEVRSYDVIITIMGTTGRSAVVPKDIPIAIASKHLATITLDHDRAEPEFVSQAIHRHPVILEQIARANRGAIMAGLNLGLIRSLELPMPPVPLQRDFAKATARIRALQRNVEAAVGAADSLFGSLCQRLFSEISPEAATETVQLSKKAENAAC